MKLDLLAVSQPITSLSIKAIHKRVDYSDIFLSFADTSSSIVLFMI